MRCANDTTMIRRVRRSISLSSSAIASPFQTRRPLLYGTTPAFLERLGLESLASLPPLAPLLGAVAEELDEAPPEVIDDDSPARIGSAGEGTAQESP